MGGPESGPLISAREYGAMSYKDILVHLDDSGSSAARLAAAVQLAVAHGAALTGLYIVPDYDSAFLAAGYAAPELLAVARQAGEKQLQQQEAVFRSATVTSGVVAEWRCAQGDAAYQFILHAGCHDLAVIGQSDPQDPASAPAWFIGQVLLGAGRPVLIVPYIGPGPGGGDRALIAWNGGREAVRAVSDALPLLRKARQVHVMVVQQPGGGAPQEAVSGAALCRHLARHGIAAHSELLPASDLEVGDVILARATDAGANLIVMGAYGHSRLREIVLGGVTRHLLHHMTALVLMSH